MFFPECNYKLLFSNDEPIAYLLMNDANNKMCCINCYNMNLNLKQQEFSKFYHSNIFPYKQTCHFCNETIVEGQTSYWPELFAKV